MLENKSLTNTDNFQMPLHKDFVSIVTLFASSIARSVRLKGVGLNDLHFALWKFDRSMFDFVTPVFG